MSQFVTVGPIGEVCYNIRYITSYYRWPYRRGVLEYPIYHSLLPLALKARCVRISDISHRITVGPIGEVC